ncbi:MAG: hypothetical protein RL642_404 [Bacteroidota bacterium]|jgi:tagaturonate reductase
MERLNKELFKAIVTPAQNSVLTYPEKVLQFGTGVLLRALPEFYIDIANREERFCGRVVMVKSTPGEPDPAFEKQDCLYTHQIKGIQEGQLVEEVHINASISRCLYAQKDWNKILAIAVSPELEVIISNTTEVGIVYVKEGVVNGIPHSFPGKLLAILYQRYLYYHGDPQKGLIVLPTELIDNNADTLLNILNQLAEFNQLSNEFIHWLNNSNNFCNTLVDRIVPGKINASFQDKAQKELGYRDDLIIMSEPYALWAIEDKNGFLATKLGFLHDSLGCKLVDDLYVYKELKLRLLNATHSFCCAYAMRLGFTFVREAMQNAEFRNFVTRLMEEIKLVLKTDTMLNHDLINEFSAAVFDRICNPFIDHKWESISLYYATKVRVRCIPLIRKAIASETLGYDNMLKGLEEYNIFANGELSEFLQNEVYGKK